MKIIHFLILDHNWFDVGLKESTVFDVERNSLKKSKLVSFSQCGNLRKMMSFRFYVNSTFENINSSKLISRKKMNGRKILLKIFTL